MGNDWLIELSFDLNAMEHNGYYPLLMSVVQLNSDPPSPGWTTMFAQGDTIKFRLVNYTKNPVSMTMNWLTITCSSAGTGELVDILKEGVVAAENPLEISNFGMGVGSYVLPPADSGQAEYWSILTSEPPLAEVTFSLAETPEPHRFLLKFEAASGLLKFRHDPEIFIGPGS